MLLFLANEVNKIILRKDIFTAVGGKDILSIELMLIYLT